MEENFEDDFSGGMLTAEEAAKIPPAEPEAPEVEGKEDNAPEPIPEPEGSEGVKESPEEGAEPQGIFDDLEGEVVDSEVPDFVKSLGYGSVEEVKAALEKKATEGSDVTYANDEVAAHVEAINTIAANGGDWRKAVDVQNQISVKKERLSSYEKNLEFLDSIKKVNDVQKHVEFLKKKYASDGLSSENVAAMVDALNGMDDHQVIAASIRAALDWSNQLRSEKTALRAELSELEASQSQMASAAKESALAARRALQGAFDSYSDSDGDFFTKRVRSAGSAIVSSRPQSVTIPAKVAELLFYDDGKFSAEKMVDTVATLLNSSNKIDHLVKKAKMNAFKETPGAKPRGASTKMERQEAVDDFDGTIDSGSSAGMRGLVFK